MRVIISAGHAGGYVAEQKKSEPTWTTAGGTPGATWRAQSGLHWADYDKRGLRVATGTHWACVPPAAELATWDAEAPQIAARAAYAAELPFNTYIRWRPIPRSGYSYNHATHEYERGVSVYRARYNPGTDLIEYSDDNGLGGGANMLLMLLGAPAYLVTGREVGIDSDGGPLLSEARVIARLIPTESGLRIQRD
jgi:hypothetical protein